jgi:hypothetical protein
VITRSVLVAPVATAVITDYPDDPETAGSLRELAGLPVPDLLLGLRRWMAMRLTEILGGKDQTNTT